MYFGGISIYSCWPHFLLQLALFIRNDIIKYDKKNGYSFT